MTKEFLHEVVARREGGRSVTRAGAAFDEWAQEHMRRAYEQAQRDQVEARRELSEFVATSPTYYSYTTTSSGTYATAPTGHTIRIPVVDSISSTLSSRGGQQAVASLGGRLVALSPDARNRGRSIEISVPTLPSSQLGNVEISSRHGDVLVLQFNTPPIPGLTRTNVRVGGYPESCWNPTIAPMIQQHARRLLSHECYPDYNFVHIVAGHGGVARCAFECAYCSAEITTIGE